MALEANDLIEVFKAYHAGTASAPHSLYDVLKDFQPFVAALIALVAAGTAYRGVMAKVNFDREISDRQSVKDRLGIYLRVKSQLQRLEAEAFNATLYLEEAIQLAAKASLRSIDWDSSRFAMEGPFDELEKAWKKIELFPSSAFGDLTHVRNLLVATVSLSDPKLNGQQIDLFIAKKFFERAKLLLELCPRLIKTLDAAIEKLPSLELPLKS